MRALVPKRRTVLPTESPAEHRRADPPIEFLQPLLDLARVSDSVIAGTVGKFTAGGGTFRIPRFIFMGPTGGGQPIRIGLFACFHGDEWEGAEALVELFLHFERHPELVKDFHLYAYPVCNPFGFAASARRNANGCDLAAELWRGSSQVEAYYVEREMGVHQFHGVISLHTAKNSSRFSAACPSALLQEAVAGPALLATRRFSPAGADSAVGLAVPNGFLTATDELRPAPFEINLAIPRLLPGPFWVQGTVAALASILHSYRNLMAFRPNI